MQSFKFNHRHAFTLIEMLISITILMIFFGIVSRSYINVVSANKSAQETERVYQDVRNVFDSIGDRIHNGEIDFSFCEIATCDYALSLIDKDGMARTVYKFDATKKQILVQKQKKSINENGTISWIAEDSSFESLTSDANPVDNFRFELFPQKNPYDSVNASVDEVQYQPSVTLDLTIKGFEFRTTYSSRTYGKKTLYL